MMNKSQLTSGMPLSQNNGKHFNLVISTDLTFDLTLKLSKCARNGLRRGVDHHLPRAGVSKGPRSRAVGNSFIPSPQQSTESSDHHSTTSGTGRYRSDHSNESLAAKTVIIQVCPAISRFVQCPVS